MLCWCRWLLAEKNRLEGEAARASGVDVEAPRLDCSADEWHDSERPRERRNQPSWVSGPRANASDAGLCNMTRRRLRPTLRARVGRVSRGGQKNPKPAQDPKSVGGGQGGRSTSWLRSTRNLHFIPNPVELLKHVTSEKTP